MKPSELADWRTAHSVTQGQLADMLKVARNTVSRWERGDREIPEYLELALETLASRISKKTEQ